MDQKAEEAVSLWKEVRPPKGSKKVAEVRPTVTSLLRQHEVLEKGGRAEKARLQALVQGRRNWDQEAARTSKQLKEEKEQEAEDARRLLKAKLAYHKAIAASKQAIHQKQQAAASVRTEGRRLKEKLEGEQEAEMERRRSLAAEMKEEILESKRQSEELQVQKRRLAQELKEETSRLQSEGRRKEEEEMIGRKERIQRIQASKLAMKQSTSLSAKAFQGALGSPDAEIKLKVAKEAEARALEEKRRRVQEGKAERERKLAGVEKKLTSHLTQSQAQRQLHSKFKDLPVFKHHVTQDQEINKLAAELQKLKRMNNPLKYSSNADQGHNTPSKAS